MMTVRRIDVLSLAKLQAIVMFGFGLIIAAFLLLGLVFGLSAGEGNEAAQMLGGGIVGIVMLLIFYPIFGFIAGAIGAVIYNLAANAIGGLRIELESADASGPVD